MPRLERVEKPRLQWFAFSRREHAVFFRNRENAVLRAPLQRRGDLFPRQRAQRLHAQERERVVRHVAHISDVQHILVPVERYL